MVCDWYRGLSGEEKLKKEKENMQKTGIEVCLIQAKTKKT